MAPQETLVVSVVVECYSGHSYADHPTAFIWRGERHEIECVLRQWRSPDGPGFRVLTGNGAQFDLTYSETQDEWSLHLPPDGRTSP